MSLETISSLEKSANQFYNIPHQESDLQSLDSRLIQAYSNTLVNSNKEKVSIMTKLEQPGIISDPKELLALQVRTSNYNLNVSLVGTLARKTVSAVESLLRS